jgi:hypothetical protein
MKRPRSAGPAALSCLLTALSALGYSGASGAPAPDVVTVAATVPSAALDGSSTGQVTFSRAGDTTAGLVVAFALSGTAVKWVDYYRLPQGDMPVSLTIPAGASSATLAITAKGNSTGASPETAVFTVAAGTSYSIGAASTATITIAPAAGALPTLSVAATAPTTSIGGAAPALLTFSRTGASLVTVNVRAFRDRGQVERLLPPPPGRHAGLRHDSRRVLVDDACDHGQGQHHRGEPGDGGLHLSGTPPTRSARQVRHGHDRGAASPSLGHRRPRRFRPPRWTDRRPGSSRSRRTGSTTGSLTVSYALSGTAVKWTDYYRLPQGDMPVAVTIPAGSSSATLAITAKANTTGANPETAVFTLSGGPSYSVGSPAAATITIGVSSGAAPAPRPHPLPRRRCPPRRARRPPAAPTPRAARWTAPT